MSDIQKTVHCDELSRLSIKYKEPLTDDEEGYNVLARVTQLTDFKPSSFPVTYR